MAIFPSNSFSRDNVKARWEERYTSEAINKKFLGLPRGVYLGFIPQTTPSSLSLTLATDTSNGVSLVRVESGSDTSASMIDIIVTDPVILDFTGHVSWPVYVIASANYQVGQPTTGQIFTRQTPASSSEEVNICRVDRPGNTGDLIISPTTVFPTNDINSRQEPYAFDGASPQKFGFMPSGSYEALVLAESTTAEVIASRQNMAGDISEDFDPLNPQSTGLPDRLNSDLTGHSMAGRLGLRNINVPSNSNYSIPGNIVSIAFTGAAFSYGDLVTTTSSVSNYGIVIDGGTSPMTVDVTYGTFSSGTITTYPSVSSSRTISSVTPLTDHLNVSGSFSTKRRYVESPINYPAVDSSSSSTLSEDISSAIDPGGSETVIGAITSNTGADPGVTADAYRNICQINHTDTGIRLTDVDGTVSGSVGATIYGRLDFITSSASSDDYLKNHLPSSLSATFVNASPTVVLNVNPAGLVSVGDIIQLPISKITMTLADATGFNLEDLVENGSGATGIIRNVSGSTIVVIITGGSWTITTGNITDTTTSNTTAYNTAAISTVGDGRFYEVISMDSSPKFTISPAYIGSTVTTTGNFINRRRYKLNFVRNLSGVETATTFTNSSSVPITFFFPAWFTLEDSNFDASLLMKIPGETLNDATTTAKGRTLLAPNTSGGSNTADATKAGMISNIQESSTPIGTGNYHTLNFITGPGMITNPSPGVVNISATGPAGPTGSPGPPGPTGGGGGSGPPGPGFSSFDFKTGTKSLTNDDAVHSDSFTSGSFSFTPKMAAVTITYNKLNGVPSVSITGVTIVSNTVQVTYDYQTDLLGSPTLHFCITAAG